MINYFILRLGSDSEPEIRKLDKVRTYSINPFVFEIKCKQVPKTVSPGDIVIVWLGTNNNKGGKTPWIQGIRAVGKIENVDAGDYNNSKIVTFAIIVALPRSVTKMDIVTSQSTLYPFIAAMPVLGVNNYSSQVIQRIDPQEPAQSISALFQALEAILPGLKKAVALVDSNLHKIFESRSIFSSSTQTSSDDDGEDNVRREESNIGQQFPTSLDEDGLDPEDDRYDKIEVPFDPTKIDIIAKPMTISSLGDRLDNNELDLTPDFQRQANVWDIKRKGRLIESILLKIPLPSFYFSEDPEGGYAVVDGLQRLCAVFHFRNAPLLNAATGANLPPLKLRGLQYLKELEGKLFVELDRKFQRRISELEITANIIRANTPSAVKFNVFARLNQGGMPLNAQEIRNAIFPGQWRNELRNLAESDSFITATDGKIQTTRQQDIELVLRYISLWQLGSTYRRPANQSLDEFLNSTVEHTLTQWNREKWIEANKAFHHAIQATCKILGKDSFRKSLGSQPRQINRGLFEAELIVFGSLANETLSLAIERKEQVKKLLLEALSENKSFIQSLLYGTGSAESSNARIDALYQIVKLATYA